MKTFLEIGVHWSRLAVVVVVVVVVVVAAAAAVAHSPLTHGMEYISRGVTRIHVHKNS